MQQGKKLPLPINVTIKPNDILHLFNNEPYPPQNGPDDEINELIYMLSEFHISPDDKNFKPAYPELTSADVRKERRFEAEHFERFYDYILPSKEYTINSLVNLYNTIFPYANMTNEGFGKLQNVQNGFNVIKKKVGGKKVTLYVKKQ